ncbi:MAG TPA: NUDIX hydrolase [Bryobacteraceae bacterium]|jgi:ADP-ribose pyrophosphatase
MKITSSIEKYRCSIFRVTEDEAHDPCGFHIKRSIIRHPGSAVVMPVDDKGRILLVRQFRLPADRYLWEIPAGKIDDGETAFQAAQRELGEETGLSAKTWKELVTFYPSPGYVEERMTIFVATDLTQGEAHNMDDEQIDTRWFTREEMADGIRNGEIMDAKTIIGFLMAPQ